MRTVVAALAFACTVAACGGVPPEMMPPPGERPLVLGSASADGSFLPLVDGQDVPLVEGAQGGFHVWMKFRLSGDQPMHVAVSRIARRHDNRDLVLRATGTFDIAPHDGL